RTRKASPSRRGSGPGLSKGASPGRQPDQRPALPRSLRGAPVRAHGDPLRRERRVHLAGDGLPGLRRYPRLVLAVADSELKYRGNMLLRALVALRSACSRTGATAGAVPGQARLLTKMESPEAPDSRHEWFSGLAPEAPIIKGRVVSCLQPAISESPPPGGSYPQHPPGGARSRATAR